MTSRDDEDQVVSPRPGTAARVRPRVLGELMVIAALLVVYDRVRALAAVHASVAVSHGWAILDLEKALHLRIEGSLNSWLSGQAFLRVLAVDYYQYAHVTLALTVLVVCYVRRPDVYRPARNALVLTNLTGLAVFALYPAAPPRLMPGAGFVDLVANAGFGTNHGPVPADQYGALPSLHLAWATWVAVTGFALTRRRVLRVLLVAHPVITGAVVLGTANHYVLDVASGVVLGLAAIAVAALLVPRMSRARVLLPTPAPIPVAVTRTAVGSRSPSLGASLGPSLGPAPWPLQADSPET